MTQKEFMLWLKGFSAGTSKPTEEQWAIVQEKLKEVTDGPVILPTNSMWTSTNTWESLNNNNKTLLHG
jgi:hypothetical protein